VKLGGYTFCSISALSIINMIDEGIRDKELLLHFLTSRQTTVLEDDDSSDDESKTQESALPGPLEAIAGFNGRCNKPADTCYCWWIGATLKVMIF
jgi:geranylgeranyl transferase type-1 subunit beta